MWYFVANLRVEFYNKQLDYDNMVLGYILVNVQICYPAYIYRFCY